MTASPPADMKALVRGGRSVWGCASARLVGGARPVPAVGARAAAPQHRLPARLPADGRGAEEGVGRGRDRLEGPTGGTARPGDPAASRPTPSAPRWNAARRTGVGLLQEGGSVRFSSPAARGAGSASTSPKGCSRSARCPERRCSRSSASSSWRSAGPSGKPIPYFVMTSDATHADTVAFFEEQKFFGPSTRRSVYFFQQGALPAVDDATGRILLAARDEVGHESGRPRRDPPRPSNAPGLIDVMEHRGLDVLYYHQVDNPTAPMCDPAFLGSPQAAGIADDHQGGGQGVGGREDGGPRQPGRADPDHRVQRPSSGAGPGGRRRRSCSCGPATRRSTPSTAFLARIMSVENALPFHIAHSRSRTSMTPAAGSSRVPTRRTPTSSSSSSSTSCR